ncbi:MAG: hypothetical protein V1924_05020 [Candidatus Bathyarchaeota archaeon]
MPKMPQIIQTGVPSQVDDPAVLQFVMQAAANAQLVRLRRLEESKVPTGTTSFTLTLTPTPTVVEPAPPWISFSIRNAGPGVVRVEVTSGESTLNSVQVINSVSTFISSALIPSGGTKNIDFVFPVITRVVFAAAPGTTATITVAAIEGKG